MIPHVSGNAIGLAMVTVVGQCVGAGEFGQARRYIFRLTALVYGTMGTLEVFLGLSAGFWVGLFHLPAETTSITLELIRSFVVAAILFWPASFALPNGGGRALHHGGFHRLHVGLPGGPQLLPLRPRRGHGHYGGVGGNVHRLGGPVRRLCRPLSQRPLAGPPGHLTQG